MTRSFVPLLWMCVACLLVAAGGCSKRVSTPEPAGGVWTPEQIAANPQGYLKHTDHMIQVQTQERQVKLQAIASRKAQIGEKYAQVQEKVKSAENLVRRLTSAVTRADEEGRWPLQFAGRSFDREQAQTSLAQARRIVEEQGPLSSSYEDALKRLGVYEETLLEDVRNLNRLKEKVAIDLERMQINQGMAEIGELRKTESQVASFSQVLVDMSDDLSGALGPVDKPK